MAEDAVLERHVPAREQALAVEGTRAEAAGLAAFVDDGQQRRGHGLAQMVLEERRASEDGVARERAKHVAEQVRRSLGIEHDRHLGRLDFARAEPAQRALGGDAAHFFRSEQLAEAAAGAVPPVALLLAIALADRHHRHRHRRGA